MEEKKNNKGLKVLVVILIILLVGSVGYICYDKGMFDNFINKEKPIKEDTDISKAQNEELINQNTFNLGEIDCVGSDTCEKSVKLSYNNANHSVKLIKKLKDDKKYIVEVYIDDKLIDTVDAGEFYNWGDEKPNDWIKEFEGYIYVIDSKYLGIVYPYEGFKRNWSLKFYNGEIPYNNEEPIMVTRNGGSLVADGETLSDLSNLEFDGISIRYWSEYCDNDIKPEKGHNMVAQKHSLTFNGSNIDDKVVQTRKDVEQGGAVLCDRSN